MTQISPQYALERYKWIWHSYLCELNWNPKAVNPLDIVPESFWPEVSELLKEFKYVGQSQRFYLKKSDEYADYLSKGGKPLSGNKTEKRFH